MRRILLLMAAVLALGVPGAFAQDGRATLESASRALGAHNLKSIEYNIHTL